MCLSLYQLITSLEIKRLENSVYHLERTNKELLAFLPKKSQNKLIEGSFEAPSIEENKSEEEKETQSEAGSASVSKISSPQQNHTVEIDHASSQSSLPQIIEREGSETNGGNLQSNATPTESATPITPTAATPYPSVSMKKGMEEHDDNFVTKWLMSDQQPHNGIQVELSDAI